jgi:hypothetical protein
MESGLVRYGRRPSSAALLNHNGRDRNTHLVLDQLSLLLKCRFGQVIHLAAFSAASATDCIALLLLQTLGLALYLHSFLHFMQLSKRSTRPLTGLG